MSGFPIVTEQFFWKILLNELLDFNSLPIKDYIKDVSTPKALADKIIRDIEYPFYLGRPDDTHILNCFHGKWCKKITLDFWQPASWTAVIKIGDCEDSSILYVASAEAMDVSDEDVYEVFGYVLDAKTQSLLGGHGWVYVRHKSFGDDSWRYVETTLDIPPAEYPKVPDINKPFNYQNIILVPEILWNSSKYIELMVESMRYYSLKKRDKESKKKYEAIQKAFEIPVKPLKKARKSMLSRLRWRA